MNPIAKLQKWMDSPSGQVFMNYAYSWGAAVVVLGALFKLTHIKGANLMLFIGMGTEVLVFFISGFERPYIPSEADEEEEDEAPRLRGNIIINNAAPQSAQQSVQQQPVQVPASTENASPLNIGGVENITQDYIARVHDLTLKMEQMCRHSEKMEQSSEEIEQLSRNLISINTFYEMHLKSASRWRTSRRSTSRPSRWLTRLRSSTAYTHVWLRL